VVLVESGDFAQGTSSRSTKLVHGGVRYLAQGDIGLVREALHERSILLANAPHLAQPLAFVMPGYRWWQSAFYGLGLKAYDALAGREGLGPTRFLSAAQVLTMAPGVRRDGLRGGVMYWDGQFDDARLAVALARTAVAQGACVLNHVACTGLAHADGGVRGLTVRNLISGAEHELRASCVINATGVWVDAIRDMDVRPGAAQRPRLVSPSQGVHLVVDRSFLPSSHAVLVPQTADGRVLFAVPWLGKTILGTTDTPREQPTGEPSAYRHEVDFILSEAARYLSRAPTRADVRSIWVGLRPLVQPPRDAAQHALTKTLSREHTVVVDRSGLVTVTGGKWTTYRAMAESVMSQCFKAGLLAPRAAGATRHLRLAGAPPRSAQSLTLPPGEHLYGTDATVLRALPGAHTWLWGNAAGGLSEAMVRFAARFESACSVEDVLARRSRLLFLDARAASQLADPVAAILGEELGPQFDAQASAQALRAVAAHYATVP
jgi:glycerol-3-phosphate dehydrogenase